MKHKSLSGATVALLSCKQRVAGSSPVSGSSVTFLSCVDAQAVCTLVKRGDNLLGQLAGFELGTDTCQRRSKTGGDDRLERGNHEQLVGAKAHRTKSTDLARWAIDALGERTTLSTLRCDNRLCKGTSHNHRRGDCLRRRKL